MKGIKKQKPNSTYIWISKNINEQNSQFKNTILNILDLDLIFVRNPQNEESKKELVSLLDSLPKKLAKGLYNCLYSKLETY